MKSRFNNVSFEFYLNFLNSIIKRRISSSRFFLPVTTSLFVTLRCNLKCTYCQPIKPQTKELSTKKLLVLIEKIRYRCPGLYITGGEPMLRNDIPVLLKRAKELRFKPLWMITNALNLDQRLDCLQYLDYLAVSLDSLNIEKWEKILGVKNVAKKIIDNIKLAASLQKKYNFILAINNLINTETLSDFDELVDFCREHNIHLAPQPIDDWTQLGEGLAQNPDYVKLMKHIKTMKQNGEKHIIVTNVYLDYMLLEQEHSCYPTLNPRIYPDGSLFYPCTNSQEIYGNLLDYPNLYSMLKEAYNKKYLPDCAIKTKKCNINCLVEPAILIDKPLIFAKDIVQTIKN